MNNNARRLKILLFATAWMVFVELTCAEDHQRPHVLIVYDSQGTGGKDPIKDFHRDLTCAICAHSNAYHDVTVLYESQSAKSVDESRKLLKKQLKIGHGNVAYQSFSGESDGEYKIQDWMKNYFLPLNGNRPGPFCFFIALGHGELRAGFQCLLSGNDVINLGRLINDWNQCYWPVVCVFHLCRPNLGGKVELLEPEIEASPFVKKDLDLNDFVDTGRKLGVRLGESRGQKSVVTIASTKVNAMASNDHVFMEAYEDAFSTVLLGKLKVFKVKKSHRAPKGLQFDPRTVLTWEQVLKYMSEAHLKYLEGLAKDEKPRHWDLSTAAMGTYSISGSHIVASTNPKFSFESPVLEVSEAFTPAINAPNGMDMSFKIEKGEDSIKIFGVPVANGKAYGAVNVFGMFHASDGGKMSTYGKALYIEYSTKQPMFVLLNNNAIGANGGLREIVQLGKQGSSFRVPSKAYLGREVADTGISLSPWDNKANITSEIGWLGNELILGKMFLVDAGQNEQLAIETWREWHSVRAQVSLNQRWVPQFWWYDDVNASLSLKNLGEAPSFEVTGDGRVAIGGPLLFLEDLAKGQGKFRLSLTLSKHPTIGFPDELSLLLFRNDQFLFKKSFKPQKGTLNGDFDLSQTPDYFVVVIHGAGGLVINETKIGDIKGK